MFVQIIEGRTSDAEGVKRQGEIWQKDLRPGAAGYLGVTAGSTADGHTIAIVRFESEDAARANSERPEQGAWFAEMAKYYDGEPSFSESSDVQQFMGERNDSAGFVQVMKVHGADRSKVEALDGVFERFADLRPDLLGISRAWTGPDTYVEAAYFSSEAEARAGEKAELPDDVQAAMADFAEIMANTEFLDLTDPQLH